ncbi:MAG TPA: carotenoid 1,2-hydratase [Steroidobacteraceae bacterium]|jgi:predicted secreted hydrolase|nr:carotenoid 1,2-hydratase [Steroidobacteraceae bacterium]
MLVQCLRALAAMAALAALPWLSGSAAATQSTPATFGAAVLPGAVLQFPRDYGSHPQFGIEWWYITGWLQSAGGKPLGFQITFFRVHRRLDAPNPSSFAPDQILIAHVAISDPQRGRLWQEQRVRRAGLGLVQAASGDTDVVMDDWRLQRHSEGTQSIYEASVPADNFALQLTLTDASAPLLNGMQGFSQKGPALRSASYYYSEPHLQVRGSVVRAGRRDRVTGEAWLDHEWASEYLDPSAEGWDWAGVNLQGGGSLMAFEIRDRQGRDYWGGGTLRDAQGHVQILSAAQVRFTALRRWRSPRSNVSYPVAELLRAGDLRLLLEPLMDDQEFDARQSVGAFYWEGAVTAGPAVGTTPALAVGPALAAGPAVASGAAGRGYLELTGYDRPLSLR